MFAKLKNVPEEVIDKKIDEMLLFVDLPNEKKLKVKNFSGGMRRRLSLAIAAIGNPKIILLD
jgi:ABC-2 type transport system ATP-binding protein